jgi:hypothetical protein
MSICSDEQEIKKKRNRRKKGSRGKGKKKLSVTAKSDQLPRPAPYPPYIHAPTITQPKDSLAYLIDKLPTELRNMIYGYILSGADCVRIGWKEVSHNYRNAKRLCSVGFKDSTAHHQIVFYEGAFKVCRLLRNSMLRYCWETFTVCCDFMPNAGTLIKLRPDVLSLINKLQIDTHQWHWGKCRASQSKDWNTLCRFVRWQRHKHLPSLNHLTVSVLLTCPYCIPQPITSGNKMHFKDKDVKGAQGVVILSGMKLKRGAMFKLTTRTKIDGSGFQVSARKLLVKEMEKEIQRNVQRSRRNKKVFGKN